MIFIRYAARYFDGSDAPVYRHLRLGNNIIFFIHHIYDGNEPKQYYDCYRCMRCERLYYSNSKNAYTKIEECNQGLAKNRKHKEAQVHDIRVFCYVIILCFADTEVMTVDYLLK